MPKLEKFIESVDLSEDWPEVYAKFSELFSTEVEGFGLPPVILEGGRIAYDEGGGRVRSLPNSEADELHSAWTKYGV